MASVPNSGSANPPPPPVWQAQPAGTEQVSYGGFWIRFVAYLLDAILLTIISGIVWSFFGITMWEIDWESPDPGMQYSQVNLVSFVIGWLYFALMESSERGATVGKMVLGLRVVTGDYQRLTFMNATGRYFAKILSALIFCIGFIMIAFTDKKRGLHDIIANTLVIKVR
ncbi:MAG: RDD family protein [Pseudomonadota bacterium]